MTGNSSRLTALTKGLIVQWEQTQESWRDAKSREFEGQYIDELTSSVDRAIPVIEQLEQLIGKIRSDCE
jgi:hypothetical protein